MQAAGARGARGTKREALGELLLNADAKLAIQEVRGEGLMDARLEASPEVTFSIARIPRAFPRPTELRWRA